MLACVALGGLLWLVFVADRTQAETPGPAAPESVAVYSITDQMLEVRWSSSDFAATTGYKVQWKSGDEEYDAARQVWVDPKWYTVPWLSSASTTRVLYVITELTNGTEYTVRVIATSVSGDSSPSHEATGTPQSEPGQARLFIENEVVKTLEASFPWLRETWNHIAIHDPSIEFGEHSDPRIAGFVDFDCHLGYICHLANIFIDKSRRTNWVRRAPASNNLSREVATIIHELAHVYQVGDITVDRPGPLAIGHLYFDKTAEICDPATELYADGLQVITVGPQDTGYWGWCPSIVLNPSVQAEALGVVRSVIAGEMPPWFFETYTGTDGRPDLERLWGDLFALRGRPARSVSIPASQRVRRLLRPPKDGFRNRGYVSCSRHH